MTEHPPMPPTTNQRQKMKWLATPEGHILVSGLILGVAYLIWLGIVFLRSSEEFHLYLIMTATHLAFGRAAGMSFGYTMEFSHQIVIGVNILVETIEILLFYPLFVLSWNRLLVIRFLKKTMSRVRATAEANRHTIRKYGIPGLFVFVWLPFWMTGSVVGCVIGFLLHLHPWLNIGAVLGGTYVAIISWAVLLRQLHDRVNQISPYAPIAVFLLIIGIVVFGNFAHRKHQQKSSQTPPPPES